ncbi:hypothetical protein [Agreia sp. COWG]|uniref:hypothetical protein n=1 Tax=Agreia sp. COWG TaxID=2773266 RepID=UPI001925B8FF|nr:hypothetical protein [Agreia sp. COWG]CAD6009053.1 conserved protein of unknown function [Agreia sp. COWG]
MKAQIIDPRDQTSQVDAPRYRVYFWTDNGSSCEEWELTETDLDEVLLWIPTAAHGRSHSLWAVTKTPHDVCLIRLRGIDLDRDREFWPAWATQVS